MQYRRAKIEGGTYFFTLVTHKRHKILCEPDNVPLLREIFRSVKANHPSSPKCETLMRRYANALYPELKPQA